jgi:DNA primase
MDLVEYLKGCVKNSRLNGNELVGLCPFHEDHKPSFSFNVVTQQWLCFSASCGKRGNSFVSFVKLLHPDRWREEVVKVKTSVVYDLREKKQEVLPFYELVHSQSHLDYLKKRGVKIWDEVFEYDIREFKEFVMFPLYKNNAINAYIGRSIIDNAKNRYKKVNVSGNVFPKEDKQLSSDEIWITEGVWDVLHLRRMGFNAFAMLGTHYGKINLVNLIGNRRVVIVFDPDAKEIQYSLYKELSFVLPQEIIKLEVNDEVKNLSQDYINGLLRSLRNS